MDSLDYWAIAERDIEIQNPVTDRKLRLLDDYCDIRSGLRVLDIGCGKAWLMRQWADRHDISGTGLELNPHFVRFAREAATARGIAGELDFIEGPAADFGPEPASVAGVARLGAHAGLQAVFGEFTFALAVQTFQVGNHAFKRPAHSALLARP